MGSDDIFGKGKKPNQPDVGKMLTELLLGAFANGMKKGINGEGEVDVVEEEMPLQKNSYSGKDYDTSLLPIVLVNEKEDIGKMVMVFVNVGDRKPEVAMKYLRNFHLGFAAIVAKLKGSVAFVFVPIREGETRTEVIDI